MNHNTMITIFDGANSFQLKSLALLALNLENCYVNQTDLEHKERTLLNKTQNNSLSLHLTGVYLQDSGVKKLEENAFNQKVSHYKIVLGDSSEIGARFVVSAFDIEVDFNDITQFKVVLTSTGEVKYNNANNKEVIK